MRRIFQIGLALAIGSSFAGDLTVNPNSKFQTIEGIGGALAMYEGWIPSHPNKQAIYDTIFNGAGISILRLGNWLQDTLGDISASVEITKEFKKRTPNGKILISSWSPPSRLKANNSQDGNISPNSLKKVNGKFVYDQFAQWWAASIRRYNAEGITPDYITIQNEINWNTDYSSALFDPIENDTIAAYAPAMRAVYDSIQSIQPHPLILGPEVLGTGYNAVENYAPTMDTSKFYGWAFHFYGSGDFNNPPDFISNPTASLTKLYTTTKNKPRFMTEYCNLGATDDTSAIQPIPDPSKTWFNLAWIMQEAFTYLNLNAWVFWDLAWATPGSMIGIYPGWDRNSWPASQPQGFVVRRTLPALGQYARFIKPGWVRVDGNATDTALKISSFTSAKGDSISIVIVNTSYNAITLTPKISDVAGASGQVWTTSSTQSLVNTGTWTSDQNVTVAGRTITTLVGAIAEAPQAAYKSMEIPGTIQMEDYDEGGQGVSYYDTDVGNAGNQYRTDNVDIDVIEIGSTFALGWLVASEWTEYTVNVQEAGPQTFSAQVAAGMDGGKFHLEIDNQPITETISIPNTGAWGTYQTVTGTTTNLSVGSHILKFVVDGSYFNVDWIHFGEGVPTRVIHKNSYTHVSAYHIYDTQGKLKGVMSAHTLVELNQNVYKKFGKGFYVYLKAGDKITTSVKIDGIED